MFRSCASRFIQALSLNPANSTGVLTRLVNRGNNRDGDQCIRSLSFSGFIPGRELTRLFSTENSTYIEDNMKLDIKESEGVTTIDVIPVDTGRSQHLVKVDDQGACVLCRLNLRNLDYTDVMILSQFIKRNGSLVTYHESKLCSKQYRKVVDLIGKAQRCNLIQRPPDYLVPGPWHDLNTYIERDRRRDQPMKVIKKEYWKI